LKAPELPASLPALKSAAEDCSLQAGSVVEFLVQSINGIGVGHLALAGTSVPLRHTFGVEFRIGAVLFDDDADVVVVVFALCIFFAKTEWYSADKKVATVAIDRRRTSIVNSIGIVFEICVYFV
jgi:hypothetical protein